MYPMIKPKSVYEILQNLLASKMQEVQDDAMKQDVSKLRSGPRGGFTRFDKFK